MSSSSTSWRQDFVGGLTTFLTMSYIVLLNPAILSSSGTGMAFSGVLTATVLLCFSMTLLMGLYGKLPFAVAPGLGVNAFFAYTLVLGQGVPWEQALGAVFWSGVLFLLASLTPFRENIVRAIPAHLRTAITVGLGIFLAFVGLKNAGVIQAHPETLVQLANPSVGSVLAFLACVLMFYLNHLKWPLAFLTGISVATLLGVLMGEVTLPQAWLSAPDVSSVFLKLDIWGALKFSLIPAIVAMFLTDLFDSISTFVGVAQATGFVEASGQPKRLKQGLIVDAWATFTASLFGTSSGTAYLESASGIEAGARTGRASVVTALLFLPCLWIAPLAASVPSYATAPVLIVIGSLMFRQVSLISWARFEDSVPCFLTIILIPLTFSITQGILWGFVAHVACYVAVGRIREIPMIMWPMSLCAFVLLILDRS